MQIRQPERPQLLQKCLKEIHSSFWRVWKQCWWKWAQLQVEKGHCKVCGVLKSFPASASSSVNCRIESDTIISNYSTFKD